MPCAPILVAVEGLRGGYTVGYLFSITTTITITFSRSCGINKAGEVVFRVTKGRPLLPVRPW